jgi:hypothetical protein
MQTLTKTTLNHPVYLHDTRRRLWSHRRGLWLAETGMRSLAASVSESGHEERWSVECRRETNVSQSPKPTKTSTYKKEKYPNTLFFRLGALMNRVPFLRLSQGAL